VQDMNLYMIRKQRVLGRGHEKVSLESVTLRSM
jgi:hypothetical protein